MKKLFLCAVLPLFILSLPTLSAQTIAQAPGPPSFCSPCLFYGGDLGNNQGGLANGDTLLVPFTEILVPFDVPAGQHWKVTGLFTNDLATQNTFDPKKAMWSIRADVQSGDCGSLLASGDSAASIGATGNNIFGIAEYTVSVKVKPLDLSPGRYWFSVVPECLNTGNGSCSSEQFMISAFQGGGIGAWGPPEPNNAAFSSNALTGGNCTSVPGYQLSAGVLGASTVPVR